MMDRPKNLRAVWWLVAALVVAIAAAWWLAPRRLAGVVPVSGERGWTLDSAPPRRQIVWGKPTEPVGLSFEKPTSEPSYPRPIQSGAAPYQSGLYVTLRAAAGDQDIFQCGKLTGGWQTPVAMAAFNSPADDIATCISPDGSEVFVASARPGGKGGLDLFVSRLTESGFSAPANLGEGINTAGDEFDAAVSPDGLKLYFASRAVMDKKGKSQADLKVARRQSREQPWSESVTLSAANHPDANEVAPCVSPDGNFLYFASDRPARPGEPVNFDIYRLPIRESGEATQSVENLGRPINTAADETQPSLSSEGFALWYRGKVFTDVNPENKAKQADPARGQLPEPPPGRTAILLSVAGEVRQQTAWDTSRWQAFVAVWPQATLLTVLALGLLWAVYAARGWLRGPAAQGRFFLASLLIHVGIVWLMLLVPLGQQIVVLMEEVRVSQSATMPFDDNLHQSHEAGQEAYEKVADLQSVEELSLSPIARQAAAPQNMNVQGDLPAPTLPAALARKLPPNRLIFVPPPAPPVQARVPIKEITRKAPEARAALPDDPLQAVELPNEAMPRETALSAPPDELARQANDAPTAPDSPDVPAPEPPNRVVFAPQPSEPLETERMASPQKVRRGPVPPAGDSLAVEEIMPTVAGSPRAESPLPTIESRLDRRGDLAPSPRKLAALVPRVAAARMAAPELAAESEKSGTAATTQLSAPRKAAAVAVSPKAVIDDEAPLVAAVSAQGLESLNSPAQSEVSRRSPIVDAIPEVKANDLDRKRLLAAGPTAATRAEQPPDRSLPAQTSMPVARTARQSSMSATAENPDAMPALEPTVSPQAPVLSDPLSNLVRQSNDALHLPVEMPAKAGGRLRDAATEIVLGVPSDKPLETAPSLAPYASRLERKPARAAPVAYAEDNIGMRAMFSMRQGDIRREFIDLFGGDEQTETAVQAGLKWLAEHQHLDGHWSFQQLDPPEKNLPASTGQGGVSADTASTGLGLLPFLGSGHTHQTGDYQAAVGQAVRWLVERQKPDGDLFTGPDSNAHMYSHGIAAIALCEAYGLTEDPTLAEPAQRALGFIVQAQHQGTGGWRYRPGEPGDTSVVGWQVMALKSGEMAGLSVPASALELSNRWLSSTEGSGGAIGTFGYQGPGGSPAMTAEALLCRQFLGLRRSDPSMRAGATYLVANLPRAGVETSYYWYYGTQVMYHMQGDFWTSWNAALKEAVVGTQLKDGPMAGTWDPRDQWESSGGRLYATSLRLLMLQVYYRHLPLYRQLDE